MLSYAVTAVVLVSIMHTANAQCTTSTCSERSTDSSEYIQFLVDGVTQLLRESERTKKTLEALETSFNSRLSALEEKVGGLDAQLGGVAVVLKGCLVDLATKYEGCIKNVSVVCEDSVVTFLRRQDGSVNFRRPWSEYRDGFGDTEGEFWLGLTSLHSLTTQHRYGLRVDLLDWSGETKWAEYGHFAVGSDGDKFRLSISGYVSASTAGDSMTGEINFNGMAFSTFDMDNDGWSVGNCAAGHEGGWWYNHCHEANPTGLYRPVGSRPFSGINWRTAYNDRRSFKAVTLKLVPV